jgi:CRISPR-associated endoribonuclease Cas6
VLKQHYYQLFQPNLYCFSGLKGQTKVTRDGLMFVSAKASLVFSSWNREFVNTFLEHLFIEKEVFLGTLRLKPESVAIEHSPDYKQGVKYVCISPLVLSSEDRDDLDMKRFVSPNEDLFSDLLYESTMNRMEQSGRFTAEEIASFYKFQVVPDRDYLEKIKTEEKKFSRIYLSSKDGRPIEVRGYTIPYVLHSDPKVHDFIFHCGLGELTTEGFGMVDAINDDFARRLEEYDYVRQFMLY